MKKFILLLIVFSFTAVGIASDSKAPEIRTLMAPEDFSAAGLDKLSDAERAHLSQWVARYREGAIKGPPVPGKERKEAAAAAKKAEAEAAVAADAASGQGAAVAATGEAEPATTDEYPGGYKTRKEKKKEKKVKFELKAKVIPEFRGWSGKTVFSLDNGQVWRQRTPGKMRYSGGDSNIIITQNFLGKFMMEHPASGRSVGVRRID